MRACTDSVAVSPGRGRYAVHPAPARSTTITTLNACKHGFLIVPEPAQYGSSPRIQHNGTNIGLESLCFVDCDQSPATIGASSQQAEEAAGSTKHRARFCDLPMFFRQGDIMFVHKGSTREYPGCLESSRSSALQVMQNGFRISYNSSDDMGIANHVHINFRCTRSRLKVFAYHIDSATSQSQTTMEKMIFGHFTCTLCVMINMSKDFMGELVSVEDDSCISSKPGTSTMTVGR